MVQKTRVVQGRLWGGHAVLKVADITTTQCQHTQSGMQAEAEGFVFSHCFVFALNHFFSFLFFIDNVLWTN